MSRTYLDDMVEVFDATLPHIDRDWDGNYGDCDWHARLSEPNLHTGELNRYAEFDSGERWPPRRGFFAVWRTGDCFMQVRQDDRNLWWPRWSRVAGTPTTGWSGMSTASSGTPGT